MSAREVTNIDQMIETLQSLRNTYGGDCPVRIAAHPGSTLAVTIDVRLTAKNDVRKTVSRGGNPCVLLSN